MTDLINFPASLNEPPTAATTDFVTQLTLWYQAGWLRALDLSLAQYLQRQSPQDAPMIAFLAALVSHQLGRGHVCLELDVLLHEPDRILQLPPERSRVLWPAGIKLPSQLLDRITVASLVAQVQASAAVSDGSVAAPLVLDGNRLYLYRYWQYERNICQALSLRLQPVAVDENVLQQTLQLLFWQTTGGRTNWQKLACANTVRSRFSIITGGPGTGKTYTVVRLLTLLHRLALAEQHPLRVALAAPTGKAAARMTESVLQELQQLKIQPFPAELQHSLDAVSGKATTLHRLLGLKQDSLQCRYHRYFPLPVDVLIIDEASMIDVEMMAMLIEALPPHATLVLLGDKDQLASVEAGAVLGQLCAGAEQGEYSTATVNWLQEMTGEWLPEQYHSEQQNPLLQQITMLRDSRRFDGNSGVGELASDINRQHIWRVVDWFNHKVTSERAGKPLQQFSDLQLVQPDEPTQAAFKTLCLTGFATYLEQVKQGAASGQSADEWAAQILRTFADFQLLCCVKSGQWGVDNLNLQMMQWLGHQRGQADFNPWYEGRPVMITQNDYSLDLRNGDIGIALRRNQDEPVRVAFTDNHNQIRWIMPSRLTHVETVYAMTVHKSQGSEFRHTVLVLPDKDSQVLTKELLYTGITRAKERFTLVAARPELAIQAAQRNTYRAGGLIINAASDSVATG